MLIVAHGSKRITVVQREMSAWSTRDVRPGECVTLAAPAIAFDVDEVYAALEGL